MCLGSVVTQIQNDRKSSLSQHSLSESLKFEVMKESKIHHNLETFTYQMTAYKYPSPLNINIYSPLLGSISLSSLELMTGFLHIFDNTVQTQWKSTTK